MLVNVKPVLREGSGRQHRRLVTDNPGVIDFRRMVRQQLPLDRRPANSLRS
jgi:hypothetical protein